MSAIACVSVSGTSASLALLERLAFGRDELPDRLPLLKARSGVRQLVVLSTCQRVELYGAWAGEPDTARLLRALGADREVSMVLLQPAARVLVGADAARHLLRVASGLESFVLGESEVTGQVRWAAEASRAAGVSGAELDRLLGSAVSASRRIHRQTTFGAAGRSVAAAAMAAVAARFGGDLTGRRVLVVGAGEVASTAVMRAAALGADVTVANRTRHRAERFAQAGAHVVELSGLAVCLATTDVAILGTAAPHPLIDAATLRKARGVRAEPLLLVDLCMPRNVHPSVRALSSVRLMDLADLRGRGAEGAGALVTDVATADRLVEDEVGRYLDWSGARSAAGALRRLREDADTVAREEAHRVLGRLPAEVHGVVEQAVARAVHRLAHGPTRMLRTAAERGDDALVELLSGLFSGSAGGLGTQDWSPDGGGGSDDARQEVRSAGDDVHAARLLPRPLLHPQRRQLRSLEKPPDERAVHAADQVAV